LYSPELLSGLHLAPNRCSPAVPSRGRRTPRSVYPVIHGPYWVLHGLAERRPVALVIDDMQWADDPSRRWVRGSWPTR